MKIKVKRMRRVGLEGWLKENGLEMVVEEVSSGDFCATIPDARLYKRSNRLHDDAYGLGETEEDAIESLCISITESPVFVVREVRILWSLLSIRREVMLPRCIVLPPDSVEEET